MSQPAAKQGDRVNAMDTHIVLIPAAVGAPVPTPVPHPFSGVLMQNLSTDVFIEGRAAAILGSVAINTPPHIPLGGPFQRPPTNRGTIIAGSATVFINGKPAARAGDRATTCNDPVDLPAGTVVATSTVLIG
jgi:uncharacterized Zn-binding protein involved in type VI secretion